MSGFGEPYPNANCLVGKDFYELPWPKEPQRIAKTPGFAQHGARYGSQFYRTSDRFKQLILKRIESCPACRAYHPVLAREFPKEEKKPARRRRRR